MSIKKLLILFSSVLLMLVIGLLWNNRPVYGNDEASITKLIMKSDLLQEKTNIKIIDIFDIEKTRIAAFTNGEGQGIIKFEKDSKGNYTYLGISFDREPSNGVTTYTVPIEDERTPLFLFLSDGTSEVYVRLT